MVAYPTPIRRIAPDEYLAFERVAEARHEYVDGELYATTGASRSHNLIVTNLVRHFGNALAGRPCEVYASDMRVKVSARGDYVYPDVAVVCGGSLLEDEHVDTLLNPTLIVEVLSPSTRDYDRGGKWERYRAIPSLQEYLVIAQDRVHLERYVRQPDRFWLFTETDDPTAALRLDSVGCEIAVADVYDNVLPAPPRAGETNEIDHG